MHKSLSKIYSCIIPLSNQVRKKSINKKKTFFNTDLAKKV